MTMHYPVLLAILMTPLVAQAQNLVPNPSFEEYTECPWNFGQWANVVDWTSPYTTSADYFNICAGNGAAGAPLDARAS